MRPFIAYILKCSDGSYYAGHTDDMELRMSQHSAGVSGYTSTRKPLELVWQGEFESRHEALAFELKVKGWSRAKKEALIAGDWERIKLLARSGEGARALRQAQGERVGLAGERVGAASAQTFPVRTELVEGIAQTGVAEAASRSSRQASTSSAPTVLSAEPGRASTFIPSPTPIPVPTPISAAPITAAPITAASITATQGPQQRRAIAKSITLLESTRQDHRHQADELLTQLLPHTGHSFRLGISGVPGVGKSTFIEVLGLYLIAKGHRVAVLTIDPSSTVSGGSILGDKTRMERLSVEERAYIRPSPSSGTLGGVAEKTREAMLVCEAAGYDIVIVETVGVGQSETAVAGMTDMFVLMQLPNAGDDLQAIKKGVMELADLVVINKADIDPDAATRAQAQITSAMRLFGPHGPSGHGVQGDDQWQPQVLQLSALHNQGVDTFSSAVTQFRQLQTAGGKLAARRQHQSLAWMWERIDAGLKQAFKHDAAVQSLLPKLTAEVAAGRIPASAAARQLLNARNGET
jgi:LAO/AO transport system kinase